MKIGITSQNFRTITGHAGKARRFYIYQVEDSEEPIELERLDLPKEQSMHENTAPTHPIDDLDVLITASCGTGFERKMAERHIKLVKTSETDPLTAVKLFMQGQPLAKLEPVKNESCH